MGRGNRIKKQLAAQAERRSNPASPAPGTLWYYQKPKEKRLRELQYVGPRSQRITERDPIPPQGLDWRPWDGDYQKEFYWIRVAGAEPSRAVKCWPNAGYMNAADGSGRVWSPDPAFEVAMDVDESAWSVLPEKEDA